MLELIIFLILAFFTYVLISSLVFKIKGGNLGCISSIITLFITFIICVPLSEKLNPYKAESFFNKETIIKKVEDYKSEYLKNNKDYLEKISISNYYNSNDSKKIKELKIGCLCRDGNIVSSIDNDACSNNGGIYHTIFVEIIKYEPPKLKYHYNFNNSETPSSGGPVHVRGYFRKDGTYVSPHNRRLPNR